jgi:hypothetical protein
MGAFFFGQTGMPLKAHGIGETDTNQKTGRKISMEHIENLVTEQVAENVEQTTEQTPKMYTQEEVNDIVGKRLARKEARIRKEYDRKYNSLTEVLEAGTGKKGVDELTNTFTDFYGKKGIRVKKQPEYTAEDIEVLANAEADEIIRSGYDDVVEEVDRLTAIGVADMTAREKAVFKRLAEHRQGAERGKALSSIGVTEDVYNSQDFKDFASKFNATTDVKDIYDIYAKTQPKKNIKPMGSMRNSAPEEMGVKEYYTPEEARRFTKADYDKNPALFKAVEASMLKWRK